jgi:hypothetical protein
MPDAALLPEWHSVPLHGPKFPSVGLDVPVLALTASADFCQMWPQYSAAKVLQDCVGLGMMLYLWGGVAPGSQRALRLEDPSGLLVECWGVKPAREDRCPIRSHKYHRQYLRSASLGKDVPLT